MGLFVPERQQRWDLVDSERETSFRAFVTQTEPRLRRALIATYGYERGREAVAEALAYAWEHWGELAEVDNVAGYLYRVGQSRTRSRKTPVLYEQREDREPIFEPGLARALAALPERQRVAVFLAHAAGWTHAEVAPALIPFRRTRLSGVRNRVRLGTLRCCPPLRDGYPVARHWCGSR
jgi:DNA-directed RNA polymerase specialized sigma24 family protein